MPIDVNSETLLSFAEASRTGPGRPHLGTLHRWRLAGVRGVLLESCLIGGKRFTSREALQRFADALADAGPPKSSPSTSKTRERQILQAELGLDADRISVSPPRGAQSAVSPPTPLRQD
jgi:hypothetical protein